MLAWLPPKHVWKRAPALSSCEWVAAAVNAYFFSLFLSFFGFYSSLHFSPFSPHFFSLSDFPTCSFLLLLPTSIVCVSVVTWGSNRGLPYSVFPPLQ